jgi:hypothetical protein
MKEAKLFLKNTEPANQRILINRVSKNLEPNSNKQTQKSCPFHPKDQILILLVRKRRLDKRCQKVAGTKWVRGFT